MSTQSALVRSADGALSLGQIATPLAAGEPRIVIEVDACQPLLRARRSPGVVGGAYVGRVVGAEPVSDRSVGERVVGFLRRGACARLVEVAPAVTFVVRADLAATDDEVLAAAVCGLRAGLVRSAVNRLGAATVVVCGASGGTGCILGGYLRADGVAAVATTRSPNDGATDALLACGYSDVAVVQHDALGELGELLARHRPDVVVDLRSGAGEGVRRVAGAHVGMITFDRCAADPAPLRLDPVAAMASDLPGILHLAAECVGALQLGIAQVPIRRVALERSPDTLRRWHRDGFVGITVVDLARPAA